MASCPPKVCAPLRQSESDTDDWLPVKNYISQLSLQLDGDILLSSCQKIVGRNDVAISGDNP